MNVIHAYHDFFRLNSNGSSADCRPAGAVVGDEGVKEEVAKRDASFVDYGQAPPDQLPQKSQAERWRIAEWPMSF
jgi:hypothetical protein